MDFADKPAYIQHIAVEEAQTTEQLLHILRGAKDEAVKQRILDKIGCTLFDLILCEAQDASVCNLAVEKIGDQDALIELAISCLPEPSFDEMLAAIGQSGEKTVAITSCEAKSVSVCVADVANGERTVDVTQVSVGVENHADAHIVVDGVEFLLVGIESSSAYDTDYFAEFLEKPAQVSFGEIRDYSFDPVFGWVQIEEAVYRTAVELPPRQINAGASAFLDAITATAVNAHRGVHCTCGSVCRVCLRVAYIDSTGIRNKSPWSGEHVIQVEGSHYARNIVAY